MKDKPIKIGSAPSYGESGMTDVEYDEDDVQSKK